MNLNEIKKLLKPLIKETVKEVLFESGVLSGIVAEVAKGMQGQVIQESKQTFKHKSKLNCLFYRFMCWNNGACWNVSLRHDKSKFIRAKLQNNFAV